MAKSNHNKTRGAQNTWMADISEKNIRQLAERLFDVAGTPREVRNQHFEQFDAFKKTLDGAKKAAQKS